MQATFSELDNAFRALPPQSKVTVVGHRRPDADCIGAQIATATYCQHLGHQVAITLCDPLPHNLEFLCAPFKSLFTESLDSESIIIAVDCSNRDRFPSALDIDNVHLNIDHHADNDFFAEHNIVLKNSVATCAILTDYLTHHNINFSEAVWSALYAGILTDSGRFAFRGVTEHVFTTASKLAQKQIPISDITRQLYANDELKRQQLLGHFLQTLEIYENGTIAVGYVSQAAMDALDAGLQHTEGFASYTIGIKGVQVGIFLTEIDGRAKGSFRCMDPHLAINQLAKQFEGGGHPCAAGFKSPKSLATFIPEIVTATSNHLKKK